MLGGLAVNDAAEKLKADLEALAGSVAVAAVGGGGPDVGVGDSPDLTELLASLVGRVYEGEVLIDDTTAPGQENGKKIKTHTSYAFATQVCILDDEGHVERFVAAHDVGRAINPALCEGQVEGSVHMGLGYALTEELPCP